MGAMKNDGLSIGEVAAQAAVNVQTLRYYERRGLLPAPPRNEAGRRQYPAEAVSLIRFIKRAQELGFTLDEAAELVALRKARGRDRLKVRRAAEKKLKDVDSKIAHLRAIRKAVSILVDSCACQSQAVECPILEALDDQRTVKRRIRG